MYEKNLQKQAGGGGGGGAGGAAVPPAAVPPADSVLPGVLPADPPVTPLQGSPAQVTPIKRPSALLAGFGASVL